MYSSTKLPEADHTLMELVDRNRVEMVFADPSWRYSVRMVSSIHGTNSLTFAYTLGKPGSPQNLRKDTTPIKVGNPGFKKNKRYCGH